MDPIQRRNIILENYQQPQNRGLVDDPTYCSVNTNNESCIDHFDIQYKIEDGVIRDIRFDGEACTISTSAMSIMVKILVGKTVREASKIVGNYEQMLEGRPYDADLLGELQVYDEIYKQPNRKKCAFLPFESFQKVMVAIENQEKRSD